MSESFGAPGRLEGEELVKFGSDYRLARAFWSGQKSCFIPSFADPVVRISTALVASMTLILYEICESWLTPFGRSFSTSYLVQASLPVMRHVYQNTMEAQL